MADSLNPILSFAAGALTILSPCVLPLIPIVLGSAAQRDRFGPLALSVGLVASFTLTGFVVAVFGSSLGLDGEIVRSVGAVLLILLGLAMLLASGQQWFAKLAGPVANWASAKQDRLADKGLAGQALIGVLLGIVWSPCVGPTLGTATVLASQGRSLGEVAVVMGAFGLGIAVVLLILSLATRKFLQRWQGRMMATGHRGKVVLGALLITVGLAILLGLDRLLEAAILSVSPDWLVEWSTRF